MGKILYNSNLEEPFKVSRSKIDLFIQCPKCFYLEVKMGVSRPKGFPFTLNNAVDVLFKKEFDFHRAKKEAHPLMKHYGIKAVPFEHTMIEDWRNTFKGIRYHHKPTNFLVFGAIDDVWIDDNENLMIVDYKATSTNYGIDMNVPWRDGYKRQIEIYQWLFRQNNFKVSNTGYFVYANGKKDKEAFDSKLEFDVEIFSYEGKDDWIEPKIREIKQCLDKEEIPLSNPRCEYCSYREKVQQKENI